jgi:hypothetical protein
MDEKPESQSLGPDRLYREKADFLLRENMNKLKGLIDLLCLGAMDEMGPEERDEFLQKIKLHMDTLYEKLESSIASDA